MAGKATRSKSTTSYRRKELRARLINDYLLEKWGAVAAAHQRAVDLGYLHVADYGSHEALETGSVSPTGVEASELVWTGEEKARFFELLGRKSRARIDEVAQIIGKSPAQCTYYVDKIESQISAQRIGFSIYSAPQAEEAGPKEMDYPPLSAAEEAEALRPMTAEMIDSYKKRVETVPVVECSVDDCWLNCRRASKELHASAGMLSCVKQVLELKLRGWIELIMSKSCHPSGKHSLSELKYLMRKDADAFYGPILGKLVGTGAMASYLEATSHNESLEETVHMGRDLGTDTQSSDSDAESFAGVKSRPKRARIADGTQSSRQREPETDASTTLETRSM